MSKKETGHMGPPKGHQGPMGGMMGGRGSGEKAKDFKGSLAKLIKYLRPYLIIIFVAIAFTIISTVLSILAPTYIGKLTDEVACFNVWLTN